MNSKDPEYKEHRVETDHGQILKRERIKRGLSLRAAGELIGISHSYLASLENGADPRTGMPLVPSREVIAKICAAYDLGTKDTAILMNSGAEEDLLRFMAKRIYELKATSPTKYREILNIVMGNTEK